MEYRSVKDNFVEVEINGVRVSGTYGAHLDKREDIILDYADIDSAYIPETELDDGTLIPEKELTWEDIDIEVYDILEERCIEFAKKSNNWDCEYYNPEDRYIEY